jgi:hypothetical protein
LERRSIAMAGVASFASVLPLCCWFCCQFLELKLLAFNNVASVASFQTSYTKSLRYDDSTVQISFHTTSLATAILDTGTGDSAFRIRKCPVSSKPLNSPIKSPFPTSFPGCIPYTQKM